VAHQSEAVVAVGVWQQQRLVVAETEVLSGALGLQEWCWQCWGWEVGKAGQELLGKPVMVVEVVVVEVVVVGVVEVVGVVAAAHAAVVVEDRIGDWVDSFVGECR